MSDEWQFPHFGMPWPYLLCHKCVGYEPRAMLSTVFVCIYESKLPQQNSSVLIWPQLSTCQESMACSLSWNCTNNSAEPCKILVKSMLESIPVPGSHCWACRAGQVMIPYTSHSSLLHCRDCTLTLSGQLCNNCWVSVLQRFHLGHTQLTVMGEPDCKLRHC